jgi:hypothetical protein
VPPLSVSSNPSTLSEYPVAGYVFFFVFPSLVRVFRAVKGFIILEISLEMGELCCV